MPKALFFPLWVSVAGLLGGLFACGVLLDVAALVATNPLFNSALLGLWGLGVVLALVPVLRLQQESRCLAHHRLDQLRLLRPLVVLHHRNPFSTRAQMLAVLDRCGQTLGFYGVRYVASALIFVGLIGTLWGLSRTILEIADVIGHLPTQGVSEALFASLKDQLRRPLWGMGMAFSSSLFGVAGSVTLNFITMQVDKGTDGFFQASEAWALRLFKHADAPALGATADGQANADERLQHYARGLARLVDLSEGLGARQTELMDATITLCQRLGGLTETLRTHNAGLAMLREDQLANRQAWEVLAKRLQDSALASDETSRTYLAQIAQHMQSLHRVLSHSTSGHP